MNLGEEIDGVFIKLEEHPLKLDPVCDDPFPLPDFPLPVKSLPCEYVEENDIGQHHEPWSRLDFSDGNLCDGTETEEANQLQQPATASSSRKLLNKVDRLDLTPRGNARRYCQCSVCDAVCTSWTELLHHRRISHRIFDDPEKQEPGINSETNLCDGNAPYLTAESTEDNPRSGPKTVEVVKQPRAKPFFRYNCQICEAGYVSRWELIRHRERNINCTPSFRPGPTGYFVCNECGDVFEGRIAFLRHVHSHGTEFKCSHCPSGFRTKDSLRNHRKKTHSETFIKKDSWRGTGTFQCVPCKVRYRSRKRLQNHFRDKHPIVKSDARIKVNNGTLTLDMDFKSQNIIAESSNNNIYEAQIDSDDERFLEKLEQEENGRILDNVKVEKDQRQNLSTPSCASSSAIISVKIENNHAFKPEATDLPIHNTTIKNEIEENLFL